MPEPLAEGSELLYVFGRLGVEIRAREQNGTENGPRVGQFPPSLVTDGRHTNVLCAARRLGHIGTDFKRKGVTNLFLVVTCVNGRLISLNMKWFEEVIISLYLMTFSNQTTPNFNTHICGEPIREKKKHDLRVKR